MKKEVIDKIDLLVEMSGTTNKYETLNEELNVVDSEIETCNDKISNLKKKLSSDFGYTRSNEKIVDENTKMGLENRRVIIVKELEELKDNIADVSKEEETSHELLMEIENELKQSRSFIESIELKMKTNSSNKESYSFYEGLLDKYHNVVKEKEEEKKNKQHQYDNVVKELEELGVDRELLENKLADLDSKLAMITESLINPKSYVDQKERDKDEKRLEVYKEDLDKLETRRIAIITDPAYIGHEAQELYLEDDKTSALEKIRELVTIVKTKSYMDTPIKEIDSLLEQAKAKRDDFANEIENKSYDVGDNSIVTLRIQYLREQKKKKEKEIDELNSKIDKIDNDDVSNLVRYVDDTKNYKEQLALDIASYKKVLDKENDNKSPKKQASLKAALLKKQEEYTLISEMLNDFENDLENTVIYSKTLEDEGVAKIKEEIAKLDEQIALIERQQVLNNHTKDILSIEKDKDTLKVLDDEVEALKHRKKYSTSAGEVLDQIEISIETPEVVNKPVVEEKSVHDIAADFIVPNDYLPTIEEAEAKNNMPEVEEEKEEVVEEVQPNRYKVIDIELLHNDEKEEEKKPEPITTIEESKKEENEIVEDNEDEEIIPFIDVEAKEYDPFSVNENDNSSDTSIENDILMQDEFQDTGYISFNDLLEGDK